MIYNQYLGDIDRLYLACEYNDITGELYIRVFFNRVCIFSEPAPELDRRACAMARVLIGDNI